MADNLPAKPTPADGRRQAEQAVFMREVDEAVRQDQMSDAARKYGVPVIIAVVVGLLAFGGWLLWDNNRESRLEKQSELLVTAIDELEAGNARIADSELEEIIAEADPGAAVSAKLIRAGIAVQRQQPDAAAGLYEEVASDNAAPAPFRDLAAIRAVALRYDEMEPQEVIDRLGPLATAENPWFGAAGELVAMAYLAQGKADQAGPLLASIATSEAAPESVRGRTRQLAGLLGYDAIEDVDEALAGLASGEPGAPASAAAQ